MVGVTVTQSVEMKERHERAAEITSGGVTRGRGGQRYEKQESSDMSGKEKGGEAVWKQHREARRSPATSRPCLIPACRSEKRASSCGLCGQGR